MTAYGRQRQPGKIDASALDSKYMGIVLLSSPVGYWPLDETMGTTAADASGGGRNGTYTGDGVTLASAMLGTLGPCVDLAGTDDYVAVGDADVWSSSAGGSGVMTVEAWVKPAAVNRAATFIAAKYQEWQLRIESDGKVLWDVNTGVVSVMVCTSPSALVAGAVAHVVGTYDRAAPRIELYVNGALVAFSTSASGTTSNTSNALQLGRRSDNGGNEFQGVLGHVAIYNTVLSAGTVAAHYAVGSS